jgi:rsbT co-antagonist protein RsbR
MTSQHPSIRIAGLEFSWDLEQGTFCIDGFPCTALFRDTSLASIISGFVHMVGPRRFSLALQAEGQRGVDTDWEIIARAPSFEEGFADLNRYTYTTGWGRWELVEVDRAARQALFRIHSSWEGQIQRSSGIHYGPGLIAGKLTGICARLFGTNCWPRQTMYIAEGDEFDELVVEASDRDLDRELAELAQTEQATSSDLQRVLAELRHTAEAHARALAERDRSVRDLQDKLAIIARQQDAIQALSSPIIQVWDGVLAVPVVGAVDGDRTTRMMEKLLEAIILSKSRHAILDVTGVDTIDTTTADNFVKLVRGVQLLGARGVISGINPLVAQAIVDLGVDLREISTFANLKEALQHCIADAARRRETAPPST